MKHLAYTVFVVLIAMLTTPEYSRAQCGVPPFANPVSINCYGQTGSANITLNLLGGPYNIQPFIEYSNPLIPFAPYETNYASSNYTLNNLPGGNHKVYIIDAGHGGCYDSVSFTIVEPAILNFSNLVTNPEECSGSASASFQMAGGTAPYTIQYSNDSLTYQNLITTSNTSYSTSLVLGPYTYKLIDNNGCIVDQSHTVFGYSASDQASAQVGICGVADSSVTYLSSGSPLNRSIDLLLTGLGHFNNQLELAVSYGDNSSTQTFQRTVQNSLNPISISHTYANPGVYKVTYTAYNRSYNDSVIVIEFINYNSDVFPGDANGDGFANNFDIFNIGLAFGSNGPLRTSASLSWVGQPATDWSQNFNTGLNYKHADCDGNGNIAFADTSAIIQNYGQSHIFRLSSSEISGISIPELAVKFPSGSYPSGTQLTIPIHLGTATVPASSVYGIAFTVNYPSSAFDPNLVGVTYANSWLGTYGNNLLALQKNQSMASSIDIGISRNDQMSISGNGTICELKVITIDNVSGKLTNLSNEYITISNVRLIDENGNLLPISTVSDTVIIGSPTTIAEEEISNVKIYPMPAKDFIKVEASEPITQIDIFDLSGELVMRKQVFDTSYALETNSISAGVYIAKVSIKGKVINSRIVITK